jgi:glycosyltransferase involved in cell wall biosynthesis
VRYVSARGLARELAREAATRPLRAGIARLVRGRCLVVSVNEESGTYFERAGARVVVEPQVAMPPATRRADPGRRAGSLARAISAARLESWKGPYLALQAIAEAPPEWRLDVYGRGPEEAGIRRRANRLGISDRIRFLGVCSLEELRGALADADALLFPSLHDASPYTVAEAVRIGCPVVCLEVGGPPLLIGESGGVAVTPDRDAPRRLAAALTSVRRGPGSDRWNQDRLPALVDEWYELAAARRASPGG